MAHQPTNPEDCFGTSLWGFGPWPFDGADADLQAWAYTNVLIPGGPLTVPFPGFTTHPNHDAGLAPIPATTYHPNASPTTITVDPSLALLPIEYEALEDAGILCGTAPTGTPVALTVSSGLVGTVLTSLVPGLIAGDRVQVAFGGQTLVLTTLTVVAASGTTTITMTTTMPVHWVGQTATLVYASAFIVATGLCMPWVTSQLPVGYPTPVGACPAHPPGAGYGGIGYDTHDATGTGYGLGSYGAVSFPAPDMPVSGGYGGDPYGFGGYGSTEVTPPKLASAFSLTGYTIEVFFNEEMDPSDPDLLDPVKYTLTAVVGAPSTVTAVVIEKVGTLALLAGDIMAGVTSVIITHTGTTLGGTYTVMATGMTDVSGNELLGATVSLLTKGDPPSYTVTPTAGDKLRVDFTEDMLPVGSYHVGAVATIATPGSYQFVSSPTYPIAITALSVDHPFNANPKQVELTVTGQTSLSYTPTISPATAIDYQGTQTPEAFGAGKTTAAGNTFTSAVVGSQALISLTGTDTDYSSYLFNDASAKITVPSTYRSDVVFDATSTFQKPPNNVVNDFVVFQVSDGTTELNVGLGWDGPGNQPVLRVYTGVAGFTQSFSLYDWTTGEHTISLIRNQKAAIVTVLWDNHPIFSSALVNLTAPAAPWGPGNRLRFGMSAAISKITDFKVRSLGTTATSTVFSGSWNFLHNVAGTAFVGDATLTNDTVKMARGPLVKGWGDGTPAEVPDVDILVNSTSVAVKGVNPYTGEVTAVVPIPLMPVGMSDVKVDYQWMASPTMAFAELNLPGLVLNKYDCTHGHHDPVGRGDEVQVLPGANYLAEPGYPKGAPDLSCYPMGLVLGPIDRATPQFIGHRYMGFEREYSALLNSPTTMLLNQNPNHSIQDGFEQRPEGESVAFEGLVRPTAAEPEWELVGTDAGAVNFDDKGAVGTYTLQDASSGSYDPDDPQAAYYWRDVDLTFPSTVYVVGRFFVDISTAASTKLVTDGVFTGVAMGIHDGHHLYMAGCVLINAVEHIGMLIDANKPALEASWQIGPQAALTLTSKNTASALASQVPTDLVATDRFQIQSGTQKAVYVCTSVVFQTNGMVTLTVTPDFPAHWDTFGNKFPTAAFETMWSTLDKATTYRLEVDPDQSAATLQASGVTTATITTLDGSITKLAQPAESSLLLPPPQDVENGQVFWGSLSREATNESVWSFLRYGVVPDITSVAGHEIVVEAEMNAVPEEDPNHDWMLLGNFGYSEIDATADALLLKQTSADAGRNLVFGYARNEPWFVPDSNFDFTGKFRVESGSGTQDAQMVIQDTQREVRLGTLLYREGVVADPNWRQLVRTPLISLNGLEIPQDQDGWSKVAEPSLEDTTLDIQEACLVSTQAAGQTARFSGDQTFAGLNYVDLGGRVLEARFAVTSHVPSATDGIGTGIRVGADFDSAAPKFGGLLLLGGATPKVRVITAANVTVQDYTFDWTDGEQHTYRMVMDAESSVVSVYINDVIQIPTLATAAFNGGSDITKCSFGQFSTNAADAIELAITSTMKIRSVSFQGLARTDHKRTLGVLRGTDVDDINSWEIPRTDATVAANSRQSGPVIEEMDWRNYMEVRLWRDPTWGVSVMRPDLPLPPFYVPEDPLNPGTGFATQITEPSAGWINVEYANLPRVVTTFGRVEFGSLRKDNVTQQRWERVRYRLFRSHTDDLRVPEHQVLNYHNVITSGELTEDKGHETVVVQTLDDRRVTLLPTHLFAERIWKVIDGTDVYTEEMFDFLPEGQLIALKPDDEGVPRCFGVRTQGLTGTFLAKGTVFTGPTGDFSAVIPGDLLKIRFGESAGSYKIIKVNAAAKQVTVSSSFPKAPAGGDEEWSISQAHVPVTVVFVPGKPITNTYLLNQPLLDGITKLNEGTPPVPKSQVSGATREEIWGSQINDPNDVLNLDPDFILNDPFRVVEFTDVENSLYEAMDFMEVKDGETDLISFPCEATSLSDTPGFLATDEGDTVYEKSGAGAAHGGAGDNTLLTATGDKAGAPVGAHLLHFYGTQFWEGVGALLSTEGSRVVHTVDQGGGMPGKFFFASGGNYHGPVLAGGGVNPLGGTLGPGTSILYPTYPSVPFGKGGGKIYRRTEWFMRLRSVTTGSPAVDTALDEDLATALFTGMDRVPPSEPHGWLVNPDGTSVPNGSAFAVLSGGGDYSRFGPWGGMNALSPKPDQGGWVVEANPDLGVTTVSIEIVATATTYTFTAVAVPANNLEFVGTPSPAERLRDAINFHPDVRLQVVAEVQTLTSGKKLVLVKALAPVAVDAKIRLTGSDATKFRVVLTATDGNLQGGAKLAQSSLLAGGTATYDHTGYHNALAGMVAEGGAPLAVGLEQHLVLVSA